MRVLAIGGSGTMGRTTVRTILGFGFVTEVVIAGIDGDLAERFARSLGDPRVKNIYLDVTDENALRAAISEADVVLNSAGPFFRFAYPILDMAIEQGRHYCDICDDWQPTEKMLTLDSKAKAKGVVAVIGLGASPGIANLLSVQAATALDSVDELVSAWKLGAVATAHDDGFTPESGSESQADAAVVHLMFCLAEKIRMIRNGQVQDVEALDELSINYPGVGAVPVWTLGHPEAITLPRRFPGLTTCYNGMLGIAPLVDNLRLLATEVRAGRLSFEEAAHALTSSGDRQSRSELLAQQDQAEVPAILAYAKGQKGGRSARAAAGISHLPEGGMAAITGIPHALFLPLLQQGLLNQPGVFAPEDVIDPGQFFALFEPYCGPSGAGFSLVVEQDSN